MPFFKKKQPKCPVEPSVPDTVVIDDDKEEIAAVIATVVAMSASVSRSRIIVRNIVRVQEQATNWNRLIIE